jgi:DNA-binding NarL/FixJ family response regulator
MPCAQSSGETIRVLVADDIPIHTQLLADALRTDPQLEVISGPFHSRDLIAATSLHRVDVAVISSNMDDEPARGFDVLRELRAMRPELRAIMLLDSSKREAVLHAFRAGARGIFSRHESVDVLCKCVRRVHEGQIWADAEQMCYTVEALATAPAVRAVDAKGLSLLSKRELEVVRSLAEGLTNREIAERLGLSQHTIKNYLFRVFDKLGVSSRMELLFMTLSQASAPSSLRMAPDDGRHANHQHYETDSDLYRKSAENGVPSAQLALARMYCEGRGVSKDLVSAYMWYLVSEKANLDLEDEIGAAKEKIAEQLRAEQIVEAERRATEWLKKSKHPASTSAQTVVRRSAPFIAKVFSA